MCSIADLAKVRNGVWRICAGRKIHHPLYVIKTEKSKSDPSDVMRQNDGSNYGKLAVNSNKLNYYCLFIIFTETCALPRSKPGTISLQA